MNSAPAIAEGGNGRPGLKERAVAAGGAACLAGLLANPLDVARVRMQAASAVTHGHRQCGKHGCSAGSLALMPICDPSCRARLGTFSSIRAVVHSEGLLALWRGTGASILGSRFLSFAFWSYLLACTSMYPAMPFSTLISSALNRS